MKPSRAQLLALRRQLLVGQAELQRLALQRDVQALRKTLSPSALLARWLGRLHPLAIPRWDAATARRIGAGALLAWRLWRRWNARKPETR